MFPWNATSPSSLIDGFDVIELKPLSQKAGKFATRPVSATTTGASVALRLVTSFSMPSAGSSATTATVPSVLIAGQLLGTRPSVLSRTVVNRYRAEPDWPRAGEAASRTSAAAATAIAL